MANNDNGEQGPKAAPLPFQRLISEAAKTEEREARAKTRAKEAEAKAKLIAAERLISGASIAELARSYGIGTARVKRALSLAERSGFYEAIDEILLSRLLPKALAVYELHLDRGSLDAARDVAFGIGALKKNPSVEVSVGADPLAAFRVGKVKIEEQ